MTGIGRGPERGQLSGRWADLAPRVLSAVAMAGAALVTAWVGGALFDVFWLIAGYLVLSEWQKLTGLRRLRFLLIVGSVSLLAGLQGLERNDFTFTLAALSIGAFLTIAIAEPGDRGSAVSGLVYSAVLIVGVPLLRRSTLDGFAIVIWLFAVVWGTDTMAFFGGRAIGGPKLAPRLSPSKTWSGFGVGVVSGASLGLLVAPASACPACVFAAGLLGGAVAQAGDLFESSLKRRCGVKDAGSLIPGHGGVMDRLDGFIAASAFAVAVGLWRFGPSEAGSGLLRW